MRTPLISPSILSADFKNLKSDIEKVEEAGADWIHCDIMDGAFVPNISYGPMIVDHVKQCTNLPLDVHLMIDEPIRYIDAFAKAGSEIITVHANACSNLDKTLQKIRESGCKTGIAINPDISTKMLLPYIEEIDMVLIMSVYAGFGGQSFISETMLKVAEIAKEASLRNSSLFIQVDGGVNRETARTCLDAGANVLVAGSAIFGKPNYAEEIRIMRNGK